jgi:glycosyltransferase involved in cell wall biosynthesis
MKILHIVPSYLPAHRYGGPIKSVHELNKSLVKAGADVTVYTTNIDGPEKLDVPVNREVVIDGVKVFYFPVSFRPWSYSFAFHRALAANIKNFDVIHITSVFLAASTIGARCAKRFKKPYIISPRGNFMAEPFKIKNLKKKICVALVEKRNLAGAAGIHFTVEKEKNDYLKLVLPLKKAIVIPNSVEFGNEKAGDAENFRKKFNIGGDKKIVLFMGRLHPIKGLDILIPAFVEVLKSEPEAVLVIAGGDDENYRLKIEAIIAEQRGKLRGETRKFDDNIIFTGMLLGEDKAAAFQESDIFVLPSYSENFGMAVVEAMAAQLPVVITKGVGISNEVEKAGAGIVIEKSVNQLTLAILKILNNPNLAEKMGENGRKLVETEFSSGKVAEKWMEEYNKIINKLTYEN